jgi:AraC-like DNA-binding protein
MHIVFRLGERPLRLFADGGDAVGEPVGCALIGGARDRPYLRDVSMPSQSVGALLRPGAAASLLGAPAAAFSGSHTRLEEVWGDAAVGAIRTRLEAAASASDRLDCFEAALAARLPRVRGIDPLIAHALARFAEACPVGEVVRETGYSHRHFTARFREGVGLGPKTFCRVQRLGRALDRITAEPAIGWAELAAAEGYADQAHFTREFRAIAGLSPGAYRRRAPALPRHVLA